GARKATSVYQSNAREPFARASEPIVPRTRFLPWRIRKPGDGIGGFAPRRSRGLETNSKENSAGSLTGRSPLHLGPGVLGAGHAAQRRDSVRKSSTRSPAISFSSQPSRV